MAAIALVTFPDAGRAAPDPTLRLTEAQGMAPLRCTGPPLRGQRNVLLLHGTGGTPEWAWDWNYVRSLPRAGYRACTLRMPFGAFGDIQDSAEYVVFAVGRLWNESGRKVSVMGHSQGGLQIRWGLRWWYGIRPLVDDVIMLGTPNHGFAVADASCVEACHPAVQQMRRTARFIQLVNSGTETYPGPSWTSIYSRGDSLIEPDSPPLDGGSNIIVEDLCFPRSNHHDQYLSDAVVYAVVMDALRHPGPAVTGRVDRAWCTRTDAPWVSSARSGAPVREPDRVNSEPAPRSYARV